MIGVNVRVIDDVREKAEPQTDGLSDEVHEDGVLREIERTAEAHVAGALHKHAIQASVGGNVPHSEEARGGSPRRLVSA